jgi:hypothetical protein
MDRARIARICTPVDRPGLIHYAGTVMAFVHRAHHCHHHRSQNGLAGVRA